MTALNSPIITFRDDAVALCARVVSNLMGDSRRNDAPVVASELGVEEGA